MREVTIGFMAYDLHELLCHLVARRLGYYDDEQLVPRVRDAGFLDESAWDEPGYVQVACGSAYLARRRRLPVRVLLAAVTRPAFWVIAGGGHTGLDRGGVVADFPPGSPPALLLRAWLRARGVGEHVRLVPARDDRARLGLVEEGRARAALVSAAMPPTLVRSRGFRVLGCLGDEICFVSAGLAVAEPTLEQHGPVIRALVRVFERALQAIEDAAPEVVGVVADHLALERDVASEVLDELRRCHTAGGRAPRSALADGLAMLEDTGPPGTPVELGELYAERALS